MEYKFTPSFVPIIYKEDYDEAAKDFLKKFCPEALVTPMPVPIIDIAKKKIQLKIIDTEQLSENLDILGTIVFFDGQIDVYDSNMKQYLSYEVNSKTVLIDRNIHLEGRENNTIAHECVHWHFHRNYFTNLRKKRNFDIAFRCPRKIIKDDASSLRDEVWMEAQAVGIAPRILMPKSMAIIKIKELLTKHRYYTIDPADRIAVLRCVVDELAAFFHVSKVSAKIRMVDLGFLSPEDSLQIYNYDDAQIFSDAYKQPLTVKSSERPLTRQIDINSAFIEYCKNPLFREVLQTGRFCYVDSYFVIRNSKYIIAQSDGSLSLTEYAKKHLTECALVFTRSIDFSLESISNLPKNMMGFLTRTEYYKYKRLPQYTSNVQNDAAIARALEIVKDEYNSLCAERQATSKTLWQRICEIMEAKNYDLNMLKRRSHLDDMTISRLKNNKIKNQSMRTIIAICVGLDLDLRTSEELLKLAKLALNNDPECIAYEMILTTFKGCSMDERNEVLKKLGIKPLGSAPEE